jgi:hypothetical protein
MKVTNAGSFLGPILGQRAVNTAAKALGLSANTDVYLPSRVAKSAPSLAPTPHVQHPQWREHLTDKVHVRGAVYLSNRKGKKLWDLTSRTLPKNVALKFTVTTQVKAPYEVHWQVVNSGAEAAAENDLRGGFYPDPGTSHWETTKYAGTHWIEAFVVKDNICIGRSGKVLIRIRG